MTEFINDPLIEPFGSLMTWINTNTNEENYILFAKFRKIIQTFYLFVMLLNIFVFFLFTTDRKVHQLHFIYEHIIENYILYPHAFVGQSFNLNCYLIQIRKIKNKLFSSFKKFASKLNE